jgi:hypothetical protein
VFIRAKYFLLCEVSASGPVSRMITYDLPFPPTERSKPSYLQIEYAVYTSQNLMTSCTYKKAEIKKKAYDTCLGWNLEEVKVV